MSEEENKKAEEKEENNNGENGNGNNGNGEEKKNEELGKNVIAAEITDEMEKSYIDYAMSVIVARALPSVEDGLKPVHRRILYAMYLMGLKPGSQTRKCARIVGDCMGRFHPHGDMAIYDSLVRMAQDFSLRYPLVYGQGNFGCFTADTKIELTDGRNLSFIDLINEHQQGKRNFTFTTNNGIIEIAEIKNPRKTKENAEIIKIVLDNGEEIKCTLNHKFMLRDGTYKEAKELKKGDSLMPIYLKLSTEKDKIKPALRGYQMVYQPKTNTWIPCHNLADEWNLKKGIYKNNEGKIRHHIDFNKLNNNPNNIKRIKWEEHWKFHKEHTSKLHEDNNYKKKIAEGRKKYWNNLKNKEAYSLRLSERNKKNWENQAYREHMKKFLSDVNIKFIKEHPEAKEKASKNLKQLWKNEQYREMMSKLKSKEMKERWQRKDPSLKKFNSESSKKLWSNPKHREHISDLSKKQWENNKEKLINAYKNKWKTDIEFRNYFLRILSENGRKANYYRFLNVCKKTFELFNELNEENYEKVRKSYNSRNGAGIIKFSIALERFFNNDIEKVHKEIGVQTAKLNHKIVKIESLKEFADVYDLTIDKTHNFALASGVFVHNSIDNDPPAAMRYTEAKLNDMAMELLEDLDRDTVKFLPNFDNTSEEPEVLPAKLPNLLINGSSGIAVGMATNIPPHNLTEVCDGIIKYIENPEISIEKLADIIQGPDFPTAGLISGDIVGIYKTGKGRITLRGKLTTEERKGREVIVITEIPYMVNKADLVAQIAKLAQEKKLQEISDVRDESARGKIRVVIELRKGINSKFVINKLYKYTRLQDSFDANLLALVKGKPQVLDLKRFIVEYVKHRKNVVEKRTKFELKKAEDRLEIVKGLFIALKDIDSVIDLIKKAANVTEAKEKLIKKYSLSIRQAEAILEIKLSTLTHLEQDKLKKEGQELKVLIEELKKILSSEKEILNVVRKEVLEIRRKYGDARRTQIMQREIKELEEKDLVQKTDVVVTITDKGYAKRMDFKAYKEQKRGGKGVIGSDLSTGDFVKQLLTCSTHDYLLFFTSKGKVYWLKAYEIPAAERYSKGKALINILNLKDETVQSVISVGKFENYLIFVTKKGIVKKLPLQQLSKPRASGVRAINLPADNSDALIDAKPIVKGQEVMLFTVKGQAIRFNSDEVREMGRASYGVTGIKLSVNDWVVGMEIVPLDKKGNILTVTEKGYGKRSEIEDYRLTGRACKGVINLKVSEKTGKVVASVSISDKDSIVVTTAKGIVIRTNIKQIRVMGRATQGVRIIRLQTGDKVTDLARLQEHEEISEGNGEKS